jgi:glutathione S-transferase
MLLYTHPLSANAHKATILMRQLDLKWDEAIIDIPGGEQRQSAFLSVSALGQIPVLVDGETKIRDAHLKRPGFSGGCFV